MIRRGHCDSPEEIHCYFTTLLFVTTSRVYFSAGIRSRRRKIKSPEAVTLQIHPICG